MHWMIGNLIIVGILGSPVWISGAILMVPRRWWFVEVLLCGLQALIALFLWWFYWGGGIGGEVNLSRAWQWSGLTAAVPLAACAIKRRMRLKGEPPGFPVVQKNQPGQLRDI